MQASKFGIRRWNRIVITAFVLVLSAVLIAPSGPAKVGLVSPAQAAETTYGGRAYGVGTSVPLFGETTYADTGNLPADGGVLVADFESVTADLADATVFLTYTRGFTDVAMSESATSDVVLLAGTPVEVVSGFVYSRSVATPDGASGASEVSDLTVGGVPVDVTGEPNQVYEVPGIFALVINEQIVSSDDTVQSITVNALHAIVYATGVEVVVSSAYSEVASGSSSDSLLPLGWKVSTLGGPMSVQGGGVEPMCGFPGCDKELRDFVTGGGFFVPDDCVTRPNPCVRVNFGFNAGPRPGNPTLRGHLNLIDHTLGDHVTGLNVNFYEALASDPENCRRFGGDAKFNGAPGLFYATLVCDYGEPGRDDHFAICVTTAPNCGGVEVYFADNRDFDSEFVEGGELDGGNIQLHRFR